MLVTRYGNTLAFTDLLFNLVLGLAFLLVVTLMLVSEPTPEKRGIEPKAEYMIILSWDDGLDVDIDLWVGSPDGIVGFRNPQAGVLYLDKDDLGNRNDESWAGGVHKLVKTNREVISVRGIVPGEYTVNAHYYYDATKGRSKKSGAAPTTVKVEVLRINPVIEEIYVGTKVMRHKGQEETFVRFTILPDGRPSPKLSYLKKSLVINPPAVNTPLGTTNY